MTQRQKNNLFQSTISMVLIVGTGIVMLSSQVPFIRRVSEYSVHIMLAMLAFSLFSLMIGKTKILFSGLACTAALCVFLKDASNNTLKLPQENTEAKINVAHINLSNITFGYDEIRMLLKNEKIDLVSFQELTPDWNMVLNDLLKTDYPHSKSEVRIDPYGMAVYSRLPFSSVTSFDGDNKPNLKTNILKDGKEFQVISSYLTPALDKNSLEIASHQLNAISNEIKESEHPVIALGEYNMVYWTNEIREFRTESKLTNSRRDLSNGNLRVPYDHIFFCDRLECTEFKEMKDQQQNYIGIMGTYQIRNKNLNTGLSSQLSLN